MIYLNSSGHVTTTWDTEAGTGVLSDGTVTTDKEAIKEAESFLKEARIKRWPVFDDTYGVQVRKIQNLDHEYLILRPMAGGGSSRTA